MPLGNAQRRAASSRYPNPTARRRPKALQLAEMSTAKGAAEWHASPCGQGRPHRSVATTLRWPLWTVLTSFPGGQRGRLATSHPSDGPGQLCRVRLRTTVVLPSALVHHACVRHPFNAPHTRQTVHLIWAVIGIGLRDSLCPVFDPGQRMSPSLPAVAGASANSCVS